MYIWIITFQFIKIQWDFIVLIRDVNDTCRPSLIIGYEIGIGSRILDSNWIYVDLPKLGIDMVCVFGR